jgi:hypothetical protein
MAMRGSLFGTLTGVVILGIGCLFGAHFWPTFALALAAGVLAFILSD